MLGLRHIIEFREGMLKLSRKIRAQVSLFCRRWYININDIFEALTFDWLIFAMRIENKRFDAGLAVLMFRISLLVILRAYELEVIFREIGACTFGCCLKIFGYLFYHLFHCCIFFLFEYNLFRLMNTAISLLNENKISFY